MRAHSNLAPDEGQGILESFQAILSADQRYRLVDTKLKTEQEAARANKAKTPIWDFDLPD